MRARGEPSLWLYWMPTRYYIKKYEKAISDSKNGSLTHKQLGNAYIARVNATWGLIARGMKAVPYALEMIKSKNPDVREDGAGILSAAGSDDRIVLKIISQLNTESDLQVKDSLILALGELGNKKALNILKEVLLDSKADGDTKYTAVESIGKITRNNFIKHKNPTEIALEWLRKNEKQS